MVKTGFLYIKDPNHPDFKEFLKYGERLTAKDINKKFPAMTIPEYLEGVLSPEGGIVRVKESL